MKLEKLLKGLEYEIICGDLDTEVTAITNSSKEITDGCLYFAITGAFEHS